MESSFFFYDLETSGLNPRSDRIMQFAGQRTDMDLNPIDEPVNTLIKVADDCLPDPYAVMVTSITPQETLREGVTEDEFIKFFNKEVSKPGTIFVGYNNISFDDEFMRFLLYRNLYDAYEWQYRDGRSKWDMLDIIRMTRALRPDGIKWPKAADDKSTNRLEHIAKENEILHSKAHDALSDVVALIGLTKLIKDKQPKLFNFMLSIRDKKSVYDLINRKEQFVYVNGSFASKHEKTSIVTKIDGSMDSQGVLVYDLTSDPDQFIDKTVNELVELGSYSPDKDRLRLPIKKIQYNRCPSVAPLSVLKDEDYSRLSLDKKIIDDNYKKLKNAKNFINNLLSAQEILDNKRNNSLAKKTAFAEAKLYDGFISDMDKKHMTSIHAKDFDFEYPPDFEDKRLKGLYPLFVARNYPEQKTDEMDEIWQKHRQEVILSGGKNSKIAKYLILISELEAKNSTNKNKSYLLDELKLWAEAILPVEL